MVRVGVIGCGVLGIKLAGKPVQIFSLISPAVWMPFHLWIVSIEGALAFEGHEVRIHDNDSALLNKVYLRLNEDRRIMFEDGVLVNAKFVVIMLKFVMNDDKTKIITKKKNKLL